MAKKNLDELEVKKQQLKEELHHIQSELDNSFDQVRDEVTDKLDPKSFIRKHPLPVVGGTILLGFLMGHENNSSNHSSDGLGDTLMYELKRLATKKAISFVTDFLEI